MTPISCKCKLDFPPDFCKLVWLENSHLSHPLPSIDQPPPPCNLGGVYPNNIEMLVSHDKLDSEDVWAVLKQHQFDLNLNFWSSSFHMSAPPPGCSSLPLST
jgi:hypothetical protein